MFIRIVLCCVFGMGLLFPMFSDAQLDELQLRLLEERHGPALRWDNIEHGSSWLSAMQPKYNLAWGMHTIQLAAGEFVYIRVPKQQRLRLFHAKKTLNPANVRVFVSQGQPLLLELAAQPISGSLVYTTENNHDWIAKIQRPETAKGSLEIAVFMSRLVLDRDVAPYRNLMSLGEGSVLVEAGRTLYQQSFWPLYLEKRRTVVLQSARYLLESRLLLAQDESALNQDYAVDLYVDGKLWRTLNLSTTSERKYPVLVRDKPTLTGELQQAFFDLPEGQHQLEITSSQPLLLRLLQLEDPAWLFPKLNSLKPSVQQIRDTYSNTNAQKSQWNLNRQDVTQLVHVSPIRAERYEQAAFHIVRNNAYHDGGLLGHQLMQQAANQRRDAPEVQHMAQQLWGRHSFYRSLHPIHKAKDGSFVEAYFYTKKIAPLKREARNLVVDSRQRDSLLKSLAQGTFYDVPSGQENASVYPLPKRSAMSRLRLVLAQDAVDSSAKYLIQLDDQEAVPLIIDPHFPTFETQASLGEAGLQILAQQFSTVSTLQGAFAAQRQARKLQDVAIIELNLAPDVQRIKLWSIGEGVHRIALQYRVSKPFEMSESDYLQTLQQLKGTPLHAFVAMLAQDESQAIPKQTDAALLALQNSWHTLIQVLKRYDAAFKVNMVAPVQDKENLHLNWHALYQEAKYFSAKKQWVLALENWSLLAKSDEYRHEAILKRIELLQWLNEGYLAELHLKTWLVYGDDSLQKEVFQRLKTLYVDDHAALLRLAAVVLLREPTVENMQMVSASLMAQQQYRKALMLQLSLPNDVQNHAMLVRAAWHLGWWKTFQTQLQQMPEEQAFVWRGYRAQSLGKYDLAIQFWQKAGKVGQALIQTLQVGQTIAHQMQHSAHYNLKKTLLAWETWGGGDHTWQEDTSLLHDFAGVSALRSQVTGHVMYAYRASSTQPVMMKVMGPVRLWLQLRPIHSDVAQPSLNDWVTIQEGSQQTHILINNNQRSQNLHVIGQASKGVGHQKNVYYDVGAGLHEIQIQADQHDVLVRPFVLRPEIALSILAPLSLQTLSGSMARPLALQPPMYCMVHACVENLQTGVTGLFQTTPSKFKHAASFAALLEDAVARSEVGQRVYRQAKPKRIGSVQWIGMQDMPSHVQDVRSEIIELLWKVEHQANSERWRVRALALLHMYPEFRAAGILKHRLQQGLQWQRRINVHRSAGLHRLEHLGWQPETPALRIRKALMPIVPENSFVVFGFAQQGFAMLNYTEKTFSVESQHLSPALMPKQTQVLQYSDGAMQQGALHQVKNLIHINKGEHTLLLGIQKPLANQFMQISVYEKKGQHFTAIPNQYERVYQVASAAEPIEFKVHGPQWLRMDAYEAGRSASRYYAVGEGWHAIRLISHGDQVLYRIYDLKPKQDGRSMSVQTLDQPKDELIQPLLTLKLTHAQALVIHDVFKLGQQEDGSWRLGAGLFNQSIQNEDKNSQTNQGLFSELSLRHRFYSEDQRLYHRATFLGRNQKAGTVFGLQERLNYAPMTWPVNVYLRASAFMQSPAWSGTIRVGITHKRERDAKLHHRLGLELFARQLSHQVQPFIGVDRDVFSRYKNDHRYGLNLSDAWLYRPWLDTEFQTRLVAVSNQNMRPDYWGAQLVWHQMLGQVQTNVQYQLRWFMADANRAKVYVSHQLSLDIRGHRWQDNLDRWAWKLRVIHDFSQNNSSVELQWFWHFSAGRVLRDFRKGELDFDDRYRLRHPIQQY